MTWLLEAEAMPSWPEMCALCGKPDPESRTVAYGEHLRSPITIGVYVFDVTSARVPCCKSCILRLRSLTLFGVGLLLVPWVIVTVMALIPWLPAGLSLPALLMIGVGINGVGGAALAYRYWFSRAVRLRGISDAGVRIVMRQREFAHEAAKLNDLELNSTWLPVGW